MSLIEQPRFCGQDPGQSGDGRIKRRCPHRVAGTVRSAWNERARIAPSLVLCALSGALLVSASSAEESVEDYDRWSSAVAFELGLLRESVDGIAVSDRQPTNREGELQSGDDQLLDASFGSAVELMAPSIADIPGHPQPFMHINVLHPTGVGVDVVREGSPDGFEIPDFGISDSTLPATAVGGQGIKTEIRYKSPTVIAGLGVSFSFDLGDRHYRVRPSVQYLMEKAEMTGAMLDADGQQVTEGGVVIEDFVLTALYEDQEKTFHGLGGGVELETDIVLNDLGVISLFAGIHVYRLIDDRRFERTTTDGTSSATWGVKLDPVVYRGGAGIRYRFHFP
jgi:hypothetical protein